MFGDLFLDLLSFLGVLIVCTLIAAVGIILTMIVGGAITAAVNGFKKSNTEDKNNGSN